jgi:hypothetical protein
MSYQKFDSPIRMMFLMLTARICGKLTRNSDIIILENFLLVFLGETLPHRWTVG